MASPMISSSKSLRVAVYGFAYLWTLMLIAFMGVGLSLASHLYQMNVQREKEVELLFIGRQFRSAIARYHALGPANSKDQYPATLDDLLKDPRFPNTVRHLRRIYRDPMTGKAEWGTVIVQGKVVGVHSLSEKMPVKQDNFEASDVSFKGKEKYADWLFTYPSDLLLKAAAKPGATDGAAQGLGQLPDAGAKSDSMTGKPLDPANPANAARATPMDASEGKGK